MEGQTTQWPRDTKGVIRCRKWKDRQHNGQKKKVKSTNNDLENIKQNTKDWATRNPLKNRKWNQVLRKTKQFLLYMWHPSCYSYYKHDEYCWNKMENRKFHTVVKIPNSNRKIVETEVKIYCLIHLYIHLYIHTYIHLYTHIYTYI